MQISRQIAQMHTPMGLEEHSKMPMSIVATYVLEAPKNFLKIADDVYDVVNCITKKGAARRCSRVSCTVVAKIRKASADICVRHAGRWRVLGLLVRHSQRCVIVSDRQLIQGFCQGVGRRIDCCCR